MNFIKVKDSYPMSSAYRACKSIASYGKNRNEEFIGISYSMVATQDAAKAFEIVQEQYRKHFYLALMEINTFIPPHIDTGVLASINFYIKPDNCLTQFYRFLDGKTSKKADADGQIFDLAGLECTDSFVAGKDSVYLLDTSVPHAVWGDANKETQDTQMGLLKLFETAKVDTQFDLARKDLSNPPVIKDKNGNVINLPNAYKDTNRIALCLQTIKFEFLDVANMLTK